MPGWSPKIWGLSCTKKLWILLYAEDILLFFCSTYLWFSVVSSHQLRTVCLTWASPREKPTHWCSVFWRRNWAAGPTNLSKHCVFFVVCVFLMKIDFVFSDVHFLVFCRFMCLQCSFYDIFIHRNCYTVICCMCLHDSRFSGLWCYTSRCDD